MRIVDNSPAGSEELLIEGWGTVGYFLAGAFGDVAAYGDAAFHGDVAGTELEAPILGVAATPSGKGYWLVDAHGAVYPFGDARSFGSIEARPPTEPIVGPADPPTGAVVGIAATPSGDGYWLVAGDGSVYAFGDAGHYGSGREVLGEDDFVIGMAATPTGAGYWLLDVAGEVYAFGDAGRFGSLAPIRRNFPSVGMAATPTGRGYWILDADGSLSSFGDASFLGGPSPYYLGEMAAVEATPSGRGYWLATVDGAVKAYGDGAPVEVGTREVDFVIDLAANVRPFVPGPRAGTVEREGEGGLRMPADPCFNVPLQPPVRVPGAAPVPGVSGPHAAVGSAGANHFLGGADHPQTSVT